MLNKALYVVFLCCLTACGFRLAGAQHHHAAVVTEWSVEGEALQQSLEQELRRRGLVVDQAFAAAMLRVLSVERQRQVDSINLSGTADVYLLRLTVNAQAYRNGQPWGGVMQVAVQRRLDYRDSEIHGKHSEEQIVWLELEHDAAGQLVRRLGYLKAE